MSETIITIEITFDPRVDPEVIKRVAKRAESYASGLRADMLPYGVKATCTVFDPEPMAEETVPDGWTMPELPQGFVWQRPDPGVLQIRNTDSDQVVYQIKYSVLTTMFDRGGDPREILDRAVWRVTGHA